MRISLFALVASLVSIPAVAAVTTLSAPVVVVYPLSVSGNADPEAGGRLALLFATALADKGGITVKPATPGTPRSEFLTAAKAEGADYYVTGYLTPLGNSVSLVDQVVSTYSGIVVWSTSTEIRTYGEASGQADLMRTAILRHAGRTLAALDQPAPIPASTPAPSTSSKPSEGNFSHLFSRKTKATPAPAPAPAPAAGAKSTATTPVATRPLPTPGAAATHPPAPPPPPKVTARAASVAVAEDRAIVVAIGGQANEAERSYAAAALSGAIAKAGLGGVLVLTHSTSEVPVRAKELCAENRAAAIYGGTLSMQRVSAAFTHGASANFELIRYDCAGSITVRQQVRTQASGRSDTTVAIDRAVARSLEASLHTKAKRI